MSLQLKSLDMLLLLQVLRNIWIHCTHLRHPGKARPPSRPAGKACCLFLIPKSFPIGTVLQRITLCMGKAFFSWDMECLVSHEGWLHEQVL